MPRFLWGRPYSPDMSILSDHDIVECMATGHIGISDYETKGLTPNGYDLRIAEYSR